MNYWKNWNYTRKWEKKNQNNKNKAQMTWALGSSEACLFMLVLTLLPGTSAAVIEEAYSHAPLEKIYTCTHSSYIAGKNRSPWIHKFLHVPAFYQGEGSGFYYWNFICHRKPLRSHTETAVRSSYRQPGLHNCRVTGDLLAAIFSWNTSQPFFCCSGRVLRSHPCEVEANIS